MSLVFLVEQIQGAFSDQAKDSIVLFC